MMMLTGDERREYDKLLSFYEMSGDNRELATKAREIVAERRAQKKIQTLRELAVSSLGVRQKLELWDLYGWWKGNGMQLIAAVIQNIFKQHGWSTTAIGGALIVLVAAVRSYCAGDATGGWIDPHCGMYLQAGGLLGGIALLLAPGFTAKVEKG